MYHKTALVIVLTAAAVGFCQEVSTTSSGPSAAKTVAQIVRDSRDSIVVITTEGRDGNESGMGTGFVIDSSGLIATNLHVIGEARPISVQMPDGERLVVTDVHASDSTLDLAILRIEAKSELKPLPLANEFEIQQFLKGQHAVAIGHPLGLEHSVVNGIVAGDREVGGAPMWQVAMTIEPGNSGGPLFDMNGRVQGVVSMKSTGGEAFGFAVKVSQLHKLIENPNPIAIGQWQTIGQLDPNRWKTIMGARWKQRSGRMIVSERGRGFGGRALAIRTDEPPAVPFELAVSVKLDDESGAAGLVFHSDGGDKHYGFYPSGGRLRLTSFEGPAVFTWNVIREFESEHYKPNDFNEIKVRVEEGRILGYVNGHEVVAIDDVRQAPGRIGLCKFRQTKAVFRDFRFGESVKTRSPTPERLAEIASELSMLPPRRELTDADLATQTVDASQRMALLHSQAQDLERQLEDLRNLKDDIHVAAVCRQLSSLVADKGDSEIDLLTGALLIAKLDNEEVDVSTYVASVDAMASAIRKKFADNMSEADRLAVMDKFLFDESGFHGSRTDYYNRANSYIDRVIDDREGLPVTLSVLYLALAERLQLKTVGVGLPGHFMVRHEPKQGDTQLIDVFDRGQRVSREEAEAMVKAFTGTRVALGRHFAAAERKDILVRMLINLHGIAEAKSDTSAMLRYAEGIVAVTPESPQWRGLRAVLRHQAGRTQSALGDLDWIIEQQPPSVDLDRVRQMREVFSRSSRRLP